MNDGVDLSIRQFREAWRIMCAGSPVSSLAVGEEVEYIFSGLPIGFFNVALLTDRGRSSGMLKSHGDDACAWASDKNVPWLFVVTHEALEAGIDAVSVLDACGLTPMMPLTGMLAQQVSPVSRISDDLQLSVPKDDTGCSALLDVNSLAYGMDLEAGKSLLGKRSFWNDQSPCWERWALRQSVVPPS